MPKLSEQELIRREKLEGLKKQANNLATKLKGGPYGHSSSFA